LLAGGLTSDNVGEAIAIPAPYAVDVSSGVETNRGKKDLEKIGSFLKAVSACNA
jgi:phosphoribosylanthranilate isomerase